jgi:hypothetical protein
MKKSFHGKRGQIITYAIDTFAETSILPGSIFVSGEAAA